MTQNIILGGHRGMGCTDHDFYQQHRNISMLPVENTTDSIALAFRNGAGYVEFDAVPTRDNQVIIIHNVVPQDHFFGREKPPAMLNDLSYDEISHFATGRQGRGFVPLISNVFGIVARHAPNIGDFDMNLEIKGVQGAKQPYETDDFLKNLAEYVKASPVPLDRVLFSSFSLENIIRMSHLVPEARYGMLYNEKTDCVPIYVDRQNNLNYNYLPFTTENIDLVNDHWRREAKSNARLFYAHPETATITPEMVDHLSVNGLGLNTWDFLQKFDTELVDRYKRIHQMCNDMSVPVTFITDYIPEMKKALNLG